MDTTRRGFMELAGIPIILGTTGGVAPQLSEPDGDGPEVYGLILDTRRPDPERVDAEWDTYRLVYLNPVTGTKAYLTHATDGWKNAPVGLHAYPTAKLPDGTESGELNFDSNRGTPAWWDRDHYEFPNFVDDVITTPQTVGNTTTRTVVWKPDINPDSLIKGRAYQIDLHGIFSTANTSDQFTIDVNLAGTDAAQLQNVAANVTDAPFSLETNFSIREDGTNGIIKPNTRAAFNENTRISSSPEIAVDTTTVTNLAVAFQWDAADPGNTVTLEQAHLKQMG